MAAREGQGLQIAVIIFAMLTIILAITTYIFYAASATAKKEKDSAVAQAGQKQMEVSKLQYQVKAMKYVLGRDGITKQEVDLAQGAAGGDDPEVKALVEKFDADMAAIGDHAAPDEAKNYGTLAKILLATVNKKNSSVADANAQTRKSQSDMAAVEKREKDRADASEASAVKYKADYDKATTEYTAARTDLQNQLDKMASEVAAKDAKVKETVDAVTKEKEKADNQVKTQLVTIERLNDQLKERERQELTENPDGKIIWANQRQRLVWIDAGRADGLLRQTTFRVYGHDENNVAAGKPKGSIEVLQIKDDHVAEARIIFEDSVTNPIIPGDIIHTPVWSPGQKLHFALVGKMDIDGDTRDDFDRVKGIIELNGGVIDATLRMDGTRTGAIDVNTRYFVVGQIDAETASAKFHAEHTNMQKERLAHGIEPKSIHELLSLMGWKAEERTVTLAGPRGGDFRKRAPGKTAPPASPGATTSAPATGTPAPAAEGAAPPATVVDPFAAPAPAPMPMPPEADPFAVPK